MRKNRVINQGFTRSRKFRVDIMYIIYDNMITSRNMNFLIMATTEPLSLCGRGDLQSREWLLKCLTCWPHQHNVGVSQNLLLSILMGWTSIYQLFWGSLGARVLTNSQGEGYKSSPIESQLIASNGVGSYGQVLGLQGLQLAIRAWPVMVWGRWRNGLLKWQWEVPSSNLT